jgi:pimeloyl-ACP methyl ester carboxylesterase
MDRATSFAKVRRRLEAAGHAVLAEDRAGYGTRVDDPIPSPRVAGDAADVLAALPATTADEPAVLVGHSYGGHVALAMAIARPDLVRAVVIYETPLAWMDWWPPDTSGGQAVRVVAEGGTPADAAERFMRSIVGDRVWDRLPPSTKAARRAEGHALLADMDDIRHLPPPYDPTAVAAPVVIGRGSESKGQHRLGTEAWRELLPEAEVVVIEGAGHGGHLSHPDAFAGLVGAAVAAAP